MVVEVGVALGREPGKRFHFGLYIGDRRTVTRFLLNRRIGVYITYTTSVSSMIQKFLY